MSVYGYQLSASAVYEITTDSISRIATYSCKIRGILSFSQKDLYGILHIVCSCVSGLWANFSHTTFSADANIFMIAISDFPDPATFKEWEGTYMGSHHKCKTFENSNKDRNIFQASKLVRYYL